MRSSAEVLRFLDDYYMHMIARPSMYSCSPAAMEGQIAFIERLRAFVLNDPKQSGEYDRFLLSLGYGARGVAYTADSPRRISDNDRVAFQRVASVLEQFLRSEGRIGAGKGDRAGKGDMNPGT